jgi:hypothetical protein
VLVGFAAAIVAEKLRLPVKLSATATRKAADAGIERLQAGALEHAISSMPQNMQTIDGERHNVMNIEAIKTATTALETGAPIETMLAVSTSHVSKDTALDLEAGISMGGLIIYPHGEYGWLFYVARAWRSHGRVPLRPRARLHVAPARSGCGCDRRPADV